MIGNRKLTLLAAVSLSAVMSSGPALAQQANSPEEAAQNSTEGGIQDIIVTARRTSESSQRTPVSITTLSTKALEQKVIQSATDLGKETPSLSIRSNVTSPAGLSLDLRGQSQTGTSASDTSSVGVYIDDLFLGSAQIAGNVGNLHDLERVEVLKGAQGTLYGRNVTGGVLKFVTKKPTQEAEAYVTAGLGNYDRRLIEAMVNLPLASNAAIRVVGSIDDHGGYSHDVRTDRDLDDQKKWNVRGALSWKPTDSLSVLLQGSYGKYSISELDSRTIAIQQGVNTATLNVIAHEKINGLTPAALSPIIFFGAAVARGTATPAQAAAFGTAFAAATAALPQVYALVDRVRDLPRSKTESLDAALRTPATTRQGTGALTLDYDLGDANLRSITGYDYGSTNRFFNVGGGPWIPIYTNQNGYSKQFTQEFQFTGTLGSRLTYAAGLYYLNKRVHDDREDSSQFGAFPYLLGQFGLGVTSGSTQINAVRTKSYAAYGQATYEIVDGLRFTGGLRYTKEDQSVRTFAIQKPNAGNGQRTLCVGPFPNTAATPPDQCFGRGSSSDSAVSYTAGLDWQVAHDILVYAKTSRGFKSGGVNIFTAAYVPVVSFKPEVNTDYEGGIKTLFFDRRVLFNLTYYHTKYANIQRAISFEALPNVIATATRNAADAQIDGVEAELRVVPLTGLTLGSTLAYTDARYGNYTITDADYITATNPTGLIDISDRKFQGVAKWTYSVSAGYDFKVPYAAAHAEVIWSHRSSANLFENDITPAFPGGPFAPLSVTSQKGFGLLDGSLSFDIEDINSTISIFGKNILNRRYKASVISLFNNSVGYSFASYGAPSTYGVDLTVRF